MNIGLNSSLLTQKPDHNRYKWNNTHCLQIDQEGGTATANYVQTTDFSAIVNKISGAGSADIGDAITIAFWVSPLWNVATVDSVANSIVEGYNKSTVTLFSMGATDSYTHRIKVYYIIRSGVTVLNRLAVLAQGTNGYNLDQQALHDVGDSGEITDTGASSTNFWEQDNQGSVNSEGFIHLAFTRATGAADWVMYWNAQDVGTLDGDTDADPDPVESEFDTMVLGTNAHYIDDSRTCTPMKFRDLTVYNSALSSGNITELYNSGDFYDVRTSSTAAVAAPAIYYPFNHNAADYMRAGGDMNGNQTFIAL